MVDVTPFIPSLISLAGAVSVAWAVYTTGRKQDRKKTALDMHDEYYSSQFGAARRMAERFLQMHQGVDWATTDPYDLPDPENTRDGYSQLLRFYHRLAVLVRHRRIDLDLTSDLFSRELGMWFGLAFEPMASRRNWWTKDQIYDLAGTLGAKGGSSLLSQGFEEGRLKRASQRLLILQANGGVVEGPAGDGRLPALKTKLPWRY